MRVEKQWNGTRAKTDVDNEWSRTRGLENVPKAWGKEESEVGERSEEAKGGKSGGVSGLHTHAAIDKRQGWLPSITTYVRSLFLMMRLLL